VDPGLLAETAGTVNLGLLAETEFIGPLDRGALPGHRFRVQPSSKTAVSYGRRLLYFRQTAAK